MLVLCVKDCNAQIFSSQTVKRILNFMQLEEFIRRNIFILFSKFRIYFRVSHIHP